MASASGRRAHQLAERDGAGQPQHDGDFEQRPHLGQLGQLARTALGDPEAAVRHHLDGTFHGQLLHGLAHGGGGDPEAGAERRGGVDLPGDQLAVDEGGAQGVQDLAAYGVPLHRGPGSGRLAVGVLAAGLFGHPEGRGGGHGCGGRMRCPHVVTGSALLHGYLLGRSRARLAGAAPPVHDRRRRLQFKHRSRRVR